MSSSRSANNSDEIHSLREKLIIPLMGATLVLVIMNTMMFNLALPQVAKEFGLASTTASWIVTGYSILFAIASITYSRLSDFVPIKRLLVIALSCLGGASILGFFSHSFGLLLVARLVQSAGAGSVMSLAIVFITRYIPLERRGKAMALISSAASLGLGLGPVAGGAITQYLGWNTLFLITGISLLFIPVFLKLLPQEQPRKGTFDWPGAVLLGIGSTGLLLFLTSRLAAVLALGIAALAFFWIRIRRIAHPFVQPVLLRNRPYLLLTLLGITAYINNFAALFLLPQLLSHVFHLTPNESGFVLFPGALLSMLAANYIGRAIDRFGNEPLFRVAPWLLLAAGVLFALLGNLSHYAIMLFYSLLIISFSALNASVSNELSRVLPSEHIGSGMGLFQLLQFFSGAFSVALSSSVLGAYSPAELPGAFTLLFWGMAGVSLLSLIVSLFYRLVQRQQQHSPVRS